MTDMHTIGLIVYYWRLGWYTVLLLVSLRNKRPMDVIASVILIFLSSVALSTHNPVNNAAAFVIAPLLTGILIGYQNDTKTVQILKDALVRKKTTK